MSARPWRIAFLAALATAGALQASLHRGPLARVRRGDHGAELLAEGHPRRAVEVLARIAAGSRDAAARYQWGTALLRAGRADDAVAALSSAATASDPEIRLRALHNLALAHLVLARASGPGAGVPHALASVEVGRATIRLGPDDLGARRNLALAIRLLAREGHGSRTGDDGAVRLRELGRGASSRSGGAGAGAAGGEGRDPGPMEPDEARRVLDAVESAAVGSIQALLARTMGATSGARRRRAGEGPPW